MRSRLSQVKSKLWARTQVYSGESWLLTLTREQDKCRKTAHNVTGRQLPETFDLILQAKGQWAVLNKAMTDWNHVLGRLIWQCCTRETEERVGTRGDQLGSSYNIQGKRKWRPPLGWQLVCGFLSGASQCIRTSECMWLVSTAWLPAARIHAPGISRATAMLARELT